MEANRMTVMPLTARKLFTRAKSSVLAWAVVLVFIALASSTVEAASEATFSYSDYGAVLKGYVQDNGLVDYKALKANRQILDVFVKSLADLDPKSYEKWTDKQKMAFWINAYNALTLKAIIDHYPIKASVLRSALYPKKSIRQIPGVFDKLQFNVMGQKMTLDGIEHTVLRPKFNEPRIHMTLVCAAMGCPFLRTEPFIGEKLDAQLKDQTSRFLKDRDKFRIDRANNRVYLSSIWKWFGQDFVQTYGTDEKFQGFEAPVKAVLNFVAQHLDADSASYLDGGGYSIKHLDYDWSLNEKQS